MLQQKKPDDFVISTGKSMSVRDFCTEAFKHVDINIEWIGKGINEKGINKKNGKILVDIDPKYFRPSEIDNLRGDYSKAKKILKWQPKVKFNQLVQIMMESDLANDNI